MGGTTKKMFSSSSRKAVRKQRALAKASQKEMRIANKGKPTKRAQAQSHQAAQNVERQSAQDERAAIPKQRSDKLARHYLKLVSKQANPEKLSAAAEAATNARYREARVDDVGRLHGFKRTAPRVTRRQALLIC